MNRKETGSPLSTNQQGMTRRDFLVTIGSITTLGAAIASNACEVTKEKFLGDSKPQEVTGIRRETGEWTRAEIEFLAIAMKNETQFGNIAFAGKVLLNNQFNLPSFSTFNPQFPQFTDQTAKISTVDNFKVIKSDGQPNKVDQKPAMLSMIDGPLKAYLLRHKTDPEKGKLFYGPTSMAIQRIEINKKLTGNSSDFMLKFLVAEQLYSIKAIEYVTRYLVNRDNAPYFSIPQPQDDLLVSNTIHLARLKGENTTLNGMPLPFVIDQWSRFFMLPDFELALAQGRFSQSDNNLLADYLIASQLLQDKKALVKDAAGKFGWHQDYDGFITGFINTANEFFKLSTTEPKK